jgi:hypothetical protein
VAVHLFSDFSRYEFYGNLVVLGKHIHEHQTNRDFKSQNEVSVQELAKTMCKIRDTLEDLDPKKHKNALIATEMIKRYGDNFYKCDRVTCDFFHEGFTSAEALKRHLNRHDRPFVCPVNGCSVVRFGFSSNSDRDRHVQRYHPDEPEANVLSSFAQLARREVDNTRNQCDKCKKCFTRKTALTAHMNNHIGNRPFACSICGRPFTRLNDRTRHERTVHVRR